MIGVWTNPFVVRQSHPLIEVSSRVEFPAALLHYHFRFQMEFGTNVASSSGSNGSD